MATGRSATSTRPHSTRAADLLPLVDELTLLALVGIVDPPRPEAKAAIATAHAAGIQVRMITGDHAVTAEAIAAQLGITGRAITGAEFAAMSDDARATARSTSIGVIARVDARGQGASGRHPQAQGPRRGDDRRRRERRAGAQEGRHRRRDGHHRHRGVQGGRGDDPHRRQLRDDRPGGRAGPCACTTTCCKYIRFQMAACSASSRRSSARASSSSPSGIPFLPLQTLWINFTVTCSWPSVSATASPAAGLMERRAAAPEAADPAAAAAGVGRSSAAWSWASAPSR